VEQYIEDVEFLQLVGKTENQSSSAGDAVTKWIDLPDINMPQMVGSF
jgi:hypothetical protein